MTQRTQNVSTASELWDEYMQARTRVDERERACDAAWAAYRSAAKDERDAHDDASALLSRYLVAVDEPVVAAVVDVEVPPSAVPAE
jgi:hypothetical protein